MTYTFATGALTEDVAGNLNGWTEAVPSVSASTPYIWVTNAVALGAVGESTDTIETGDWAAPALYSEGPLNSAIVELFQVTSSSSAPADPTSSLTYTFSTTTLSGSGFNGWAQTATNTSEGEYLWKIAAYALSNGTTDVITTDDWADAKIVGYSGTDGAPGTKTALVYAYQRSSSALTSDAGTVTVNLNTGLITTTTLANGWSKTIPSGTNPLYVIAASANGTGTTATIAGTEWSDPVVLSQDGTDGLNTATIFIYQRTTTNTAPLFLPTGNTTYTFSTGATSFTAANGWTRTIPSSGGGYLWVSQATAAATTSTDTILQGEWASAVLLSQDGTDGINGQNVDIVFKRSATQPATPSPSVGTPTGWYSDVNSVPSSSDPLWASTGTKAGGATNFTWQTPVQIEGSQGNPGLSVAELSIFRRASSAPGTPTGGSFTFPASLTPPSGWYVTPPAGTDPVYISRGFAESSSSTGTDSSITWSTPVLFVQNGTDGLPGDIGNAIVQLYRVTSSISAPSDPTTALTYTFSTGVLSGSGFNGWSQTAPDTSSSNPYLWMIAATALGASGSTDSIATSEWSTASLISKFGDDGTPANNLHLIELFQLTNSSSAPNTTGTGGVASSITYTFSTQGISGSLGNWSTTASSVTASNQYLWKTSAVASSTSTSDAIANTEFAAPVIIAHFGTNGLPGGPGPDGDPGLRRAEGYLYYQSAGTPATTPSGSYTWSTGNVSGTNIGTGSTQWYTTPPQMGAGTQSQYYVRRWRAIETTFNSSSVSLTIDASRLGHNFAGVVTFSSGDFLQNGSSITTIDGGNISTGTLTLSKLGSSTFSDGSHTFSLDEQGVTLNGSGWDTTALFASSEISTCIALTATATGNGTTTRGLFAAARAGIAATFIQDSTQAWGGTSSKYIDLCSYTGDLISGGLNGEKFSINTNGRIESVGELATKGIQSKAGTAATSSGSIFNFRWTSPNAECWVDTTNVGTFVFSSDYRIKQDVETQTEPAIERVKQIRPVTYTYTDNPQLMSVADGIAREGFIAHELAAVIPSAVQGEKDAENQIQSLKLDALCSVLVKALQEQQVIIESLEARITQLETS